MQCEFPQFLEYLLLQFPLRPVASLERVVREAAKLCDSAFCLAMVVAKMLLSLLYILSLP